MFRSLSLILLFLIGCYSPLPPAKGPRISFSTYPSTLDPRLSADFISATMVGLLYEGLTRCLPDGSVEKGLAEQIDVSDDLRTYTFHLRKAYWSDGTAVTASDFESSWKKQLDPTFPSYSRYLFYPILNAEGAANGDFDIDSVGIRALDDATLRVDLEYPTPYFVSLTAFPSFFPYNAHAPTQVFNGPFVIAHIIPHSEIALRKNPLFWNKDKIDLEEIHISIIGDENTALRMFEKGELDWIGGALSPIPIDAMDTLDIRHFPMAATTFCSFNVHAFPFTSQHIRNAFSLAIDRQELTDQVVRTQQIAASECIPPTLWSDRPRATLPPYDPQRAKQELALGLQELGVDHLGPVTLSFRIGHVERKVAQALERKWKEILGIDIQLAKYDHKMHKEQLHRRQYQISLANWIAQYNDPINILERFKRGDNPKNYPGWEDPQFAALLEQAKQTVDPDQRLDLLDRAEKLFTQQNPIAPLYHWTNPVLCSPRLHNVHTTPSGGVLFERARLEAE